MPAHCDGAWFVQPREPLSCFLIGVKRIFVPALKEADGPELAFPNGDIPFVLALFATTDCLFVCRSGFVQPAQVAKTVAAFYEGGGRHPLCPEAWLIPLEVFESSLRFVQ